MAYVKPNYRTKAALRNALLAGEKVWVFQPGLGEIPYDGTIDLEGPHAPEPHTWSGVGTMEGGQLVKVK